MNTAFGPAPVAVFTGPGLVECVYCPIIIPENFIEFHVRKHIVKVTE